MGKKQILESLEKFEELDGFLSVALVDARSGMILGKLGDANANIDIIAAAHTELIRSKRRSIQELGLGEPLEEILISLESELHLLRPTRSRESSFLFLALDRELANMALARIEFADLEEGFVF
jgi:predicted regulator of Ras-like GTPase activity (Roadblock/LC7/MglB family)